MTPLLQTIIFALALICSIFFFGTLVSWCVYSIAPNSFSKPFPKNQQEIATWVMFVGVILWSILYYQGL
jgi:divalent metal cation (Fe/Co/Zn/Cd) transporter